MTTSGFLRIVPRLFSRAPSLRAGGSITAAINAVMTAGEADGDDCAHIHPTRHMRARTA
jgi:hypothetical protein